MFYANKLRVDVVDYRHMNAFNGAAVHSGDLMQENRGSNTISLNGVNSCVFVLSAWAGATPADILSLSISFANGDGGDVLCTYDLDAQHKSII